jgi:hypothetical protein
MSTAPAPLAHRSWLSSIGAVMGRILGLAQKAEPSAVAIAEALLPQFSPEIAAANDIFNRVVKFALVAETSAAAAGAATGTGAQKLEQVLGQVGPMLDAWVANNLPGHKQASAYAKSNVVKAIVDLINEPDPAPAVIS